MYGRKISRPGKQNINIDKCVIAAVSLVRGPEPRLASLARRWTSYRKTPPSVASQIFPSRKTNPVTSESHASPGSLTNGPSSNLEPWKRTFFSYIKKYAADKGGIFDLVGIFAKKNYERFGTVGRDGAGSIPASIVTDTCARRNLGPKRRSGPA